MSLAITPGDDRLRELLFAQLERAFGLLWQQQFIPRGLAGPGDAPITLVVEDPKRGFWYNVAYASRFLPGDAKEYAHRFAFAFATTQAIQPGMHIHHDCGNRACCNPAHLRELTFEEHMAEHRGERP